MPLRIVIVTPVFEDWESVQELVVQLDAAFRAAEGLPALSLSVLAVDDGSVQARPAAGPRWAALGLVERIDVLRLAVNLGHQRAIALGLAQVEQAGRADAVVVMDADGEDRPEDAVRLVRLHLAHPGDVLLALRARRSEAPGFRFGYLLYRLGFRLLTGERIRFGNFSLVPRAALERLVANEDLWNHFAAAVTRSRLPLTMLETDRGTRYAGQSQMSWVSLVIHGLSAMSVHSDRVAARLILASAGVTVLATLAAVAVVGIKLFTALAIPGWASLTVGMLTVISLVGGTTASLLAFLTLQGRRLVTFLPRVDGQRYVKDLEPWHSQPSPATSARS